MLAIGRSEFCSTSRSLWQDKQAHGRQKRLSVRAGFVVGKASCVCGFSASQHHSWVVPGAILYYKAGAVAQAKRASPSATTTLTCYCPSCWGPLAPPGSVPCSWHKQGVGGFHSSHQFRHTRHLAGGRVQRAMGGKKSYKGAHGKINKGAPNVRSTPLPRRTHTHTQHASPL